MGIKAYFFFQKKDNSKFQNSGNPLGISAKTEKNLEEKGWKQTL